MEPDKRIELENPLIRFSRLSAGVVVTSGVLVMCGWAFDIALLRTFFPGLPPIPVNAALAFILTGAALWLLTTRQMVLATLGQVGAGLAALIGLLSLSQYVFGIDLGIDQALLADRTGSSPNPGRIPLPGAINFLLLGSALLVLDVRVSRDRWPAQWLSLAAAATALVIILGYAYDVTSLYRPALTPPVPLHGMILFEILVIGTFYARPQRGLSALLAADDAAGLLTRRLLPAAIVIPPAVGWLRLQGEQAGLYETNFGIALFASANVVIFTLLVWMTAADIRRADDRRRQAEQKLQVQLARLDLLNHITRAIGERLDLGSVFQVVVRSLEDHLRVDFSFIGLYDRATEQLVIQGLGVRSSVLAGELAMPEHARVAIDQNGLSRCVQGALVYEPDISQLRSPFSNRLSSVGLRSLVIAPLLVESNVFGVLVAARRQTGAFTSTDCEFLQQLSQHVALATHQAQLYSALQQAYEDLRHSQHAVVQQERLSALGQMASGIAHDINNALSPVSLYIETLIERETQMSSQGREQLNVMQRAVDDVGNTITRMREFYGQRESELQLAHVDVNRCAQQVVDLTRARWRDLPQQKGVVIDLRSELTPSLPPIAGAEHEIRDALTNVIFNAIDAMPEGGVLTLKTSMLRDRGYVALEVSDTGVGMDEDARRRCLEPFFTTKGDRGTGLGLAMVYGMAKRHDAELEIDSMPGRGTTVRLIFPAATAEAVRAQHPAPPARPTRRLRILIVDDDPMLIHSLHDTLSGDGHAVTTADGGQAGIEAFRAAQARAEPFAVVITDLGMPYVDGHRVAAAIRAASPSTPIILLTGWGQRLLSSNGVPPNVDRVLSKPPKLRELRLALSELTSQHSNVST